MGKCLVFGHPESHGIYEISLKVFSRREKEDFKEMLRLTILKEENCFAIFLSYY